MILIELKLAGKSFSGGESEDSSVGATNYNKYSTQLHTLVQLVMRSDT